MTVSSHSSTSPIKVGVIAEQTGPLSFVGLANANVARMIVGDINAKGGLLGRPLELHVEDGATDDGVGAPPPKKQGL
jgi:branched-chain amino acid transport system substrate-binding protein